MFQDSTFESALGGDGWYRAQQRTASSTQDITYAGTPATVGEYAEGLSIGQLSAAMLLLLVAGYVLFAWWTRKHSV